MAFLHDPLSDIQLIANNLRDRYKSGFPILKEMVQNADDAGAENLALGWHPGIKNSKHPLLRDPAVFFVNDAKLTDDDVKGIRTLGLGSKADDVNAVGKFGLGMKSLFHLGELYFFIGSDWQENNGQHPKADVLNPWGTARASWEDFCENDKNSIQQELSCITSNFDDSAYKFIVWIPLRSVSIAKVRGEENNNYIYNGDDYGSCIPPFLLDSELPIKLGKLMPMLKRLRSVSGFTFSNNSDEPTKIFSSEISQPYQRCSFPNVTDEIQWQGAINVHDIGNDQSSTLKYVGTEVSLEHTSLKSLKNNEFWPISYARNSNGEEKKIRDKAQAHSATVILVQPSQGRSTLTVQWAVFLPLGEHDTSEAKQVFETYIEGNMSFDLILHGYFFIDAGRVGIHGRKHIGTSVPLEIHSEDDATQEWNRILANLGTLPILLSSVEHAASKLKLNQLQVDSLGTGLASFINNDVGKNCKTHITSNYQWVYQLTEKSKSWILIPSSMRIRKLPSPATGNFERVWETFPNLESHNEKTVFIDDSKPNIYSSNDAKWQEHEIVELLELVPNEVFESLTSLGYLNLFLDNNFLTIREDACKNAIIKLASRALKSIKLSDLSKNRAVFKKFTSFVLPTFRWSVKVEKEDQLLWNLFTSIETSRLFLPSFLDEGDSQTTLDFDDANQIFVSLGKSNFNDQQLDKATTAVLDSLDIAQKNQLIDLHDKLPLFTAYHPGSNRAHRVTSQKLNNLFQHRKLFSRASLNSGSFLLGVHLKAALVDKNIVFINDKVNQQLFDKRVSPCGTKQVLNLLAKRPKLSLPSERITLISKLEINAELNIEQRLSVRYLMHGSAEDRSIQEPLWSLGGDMAVWSRLHEESLSDEMRWTIIPHDISHSLKLSNDEKDIVNLQEVNSRNILEKLGADIQLIDFSKVVFSQSDAEQILEHIEDKDLWCCLPLHQSLYGELVSINDHCAIQSSYALPAALTEAMTWISPAISSKVQDQQVRYMSTFDAYRAIDLALEQGNPVKYQFFILQALSSLNSFEPILNKLKRTPWLMANGVGFSPNMIIVDDIEKWDMTYQLSVQNSNICFAKDLDIFKEPSFDTIKPILLTKDFDITCLVLKSAAKLPDYFIGQAIITHQVLKQASQYKNLFKKANLKGWELLIECFSNTSSENLSDELLNTLSYSNSNIDFFVSFHEDLVKDATSAKAVSELRFAVLTIICKEDWPLQSIEKLTLRSQSDRFIPGKQLCHGVIGASSSATLHEYDFEAIGNVLEKDHGSKAISNTLPKMTEYQNPDDEANTASADELKKYFSDWEPHITNKTAIATVLALFSGTQGVKKICEDFLGQRSYSKFINEIGRNWTVEKVQSSSRIPESLQEFVSLIKFNIQCTVDNIKIVNSIFNEEIEVELETDFQSILVWDSKDGIFYNKPIKLYLRKMPVIEMGEAQLLKILKNSAELLLKKIYCQNLSLDHIWDDFSGAEQLDIRAARLTVMDGIVYQLKELHIKDPSLSKLLKDYDNLVASAAENNKNLSGEDKQKILDLICQKVEEVSLKIQVLAAVKHKIEQAQYHTHSVPFELFQNADDAVVELKKLGINDAEIERRSVFKVYSTDNKLRFLNWGREVNQYRSSSSSIDGSKYGFKTDLQKMIFRNQSDKGDVTTGKFGLGFKSCLLVTDTPNIVSGRLAVQIEGGLLPSVSSEHESLFQFAKSEMLEGGLRPTVISLLLREDIDSNEVLRRFKRHAGLLTIFSNCIHTIAIDDDLFQWRPQSSQLFDELSFGVIRLKTKKRISDVKVAVLNTTSGNFVFELGRKGFKPLKDDTPKLWNLSPLMGEFNLGFAINAAFDVDIGRNQLAISSSRNTALFESLGQDLSVFLEKLYKKCKSDWNTVKAEWSLGDDVVMSTFWESIWSTLQQGAAPSSSSLVEDEGAENHKSYMNRMFTAKGGILSFYRLFQALPVGMEGCEPKLVNLATVVYRAGELLDKMSKHVVKLPVMSSLLAENKIVGFDVGKSLLGIGVEVSTLDLSELIERTLENDYLSPKSAGQLCGVFDSNFDQKLKNNKATQEQVEQFKTKLSGLSILAENGSRRATKVTLIRRADAPCSDESMVINFAPDAFIASSQYKDSIGFITQCRRDVTPYNLSTLFDWICRDEMKLNGDKKQAICKYIVDGNLGEDLADKIKSASKPAWVFYVDVQHLKTWGWKKNKIDLFRNVRMITEVEKGVRISLQLKSEGRSALSAEDALMRIYNWWEEEGSDYLTDYEKELYPGGVFDWQAIKQDEEPELYQLAWLKLFYLGSCQTIGRSKEVQHRAALEHFDQKGWWTVFSDANNSAAWFDVMDQYFENAVNDDKYRTWLQILPLYRFSNHLDEYIDLFWSADFGLPNINALIRPGSSSELSGAGSNFTPPELKSTLGIGVNFILRELYRNNIYSDATIEQHCFVASRGVRDLLSQRLSNGLDLSSASADSSKEIYQYLCEKIGEECATFNGSFDIPLRILSRSENKHILAEILDIGVWS